MNSFWLLRAAVDNKDKMKAMLIMRDKPESVARKILEKSGAAVPSYKGKAFWQWAQDYIICSCRPDSSRDKYHAHTECENTGITGTGQGRTEFKPRSGRLAESARPAGHAGRSHKHTAAATPAAGTLRAGTHGLPPVRAHLGAQRVSQSAPAPDAVKQDVAVGNCHAAVLFPRLCRPRPVVCPQHSVRVRRRDAAAGVDSPLPDARSNCRSGVAQSDGLAAVLRQLRSVRARSGSLAGNVSAFTTGTNVRSSSLMAIIALLAINSQHVTQAPAVVMVLSILPTCFLPAAAVGLVRTLKDGHERRFMPAMFFYMAYAGHLFILVLITRLCLL